MNGTVEHGETWRNSRNGGQLDPCPPKLFERRFIISARRYRASLLPKFVSYPRHISATVVIRRILNKAETLSTIRESERSSPRKPKLNASLPVTSLPIGWHGVTWFGPSYDRKCGEIELRTSLLFRTLRREDALWNCTCCASYEFSDK